MAILIGILTTVLAIGIELLLSLYFGFSFSSVSLLFIIPIGGAIFGAIAAFGYYYIKSKEKVELKHGTVGALLGLVAFLGIPFMTYQLTYVSEEGTINYSFQGDHISNFTLDDEPMTFSKYLSSTLDTGNTVIKSRRTPMDDGLETSRGFNVFSFIMEGLGFIAGGFIVSGHFMRERCDSCRKEDLEEQKLFEVTDPNKYNQLINEILKYNNVTTFTNFILKSRKETENIVFKNNLKAIYYLAVCKKCNQGYFMVKYFIVQNDRYIESINHQRMIKLEDKFFKESFKKIRRSGLV